MMGAGMKRRMLQKLLDSTAVDQLTFVLASVENELLETAVDLEKAHGIEHIRTSGYPAVEERQEALKALIGALANDDLADVWIEQVAPDLLDNPERAEQYVGMDTDEWEQQIERWAETYRSQGASGDDRALAAHHVRETFGVELEYFEQRVIEWDAGEEAERLFAGNLRAVRESMRKATAAAGEADD